MNHWLMKSELDVYPYAQLVTDGQTHWDGVRNYQATKNLKNILLVKRLFGLNIMVSLAMMLLIKFSIKLVLMTEKVG